MSTWAALALYGVLFALAHHADQAPARAEDRSASAGFRPFLPASVQPRPSAPRYPFRRVAKRGDLYDLEYGFLTPAAEPLTLSAAIPHKAVVDSTREFGYSPGDLRAVEAWHQIARASALRKAEESYIAGKITANSEDELEEKLRQAKERNHALRLELERALERLAREYARRKGEVYNQKGFRYQSPGVLEVDIPLLVSRNWRRLRSVAASLAALAKDRDFDSSELVAAAAAMVQTGLDYRVPQDQAGGKETGGVLTPPQALAAGFGDCDTKSALLAACLLHWPNVKLIGLAIPGHYLVAVQRLPMRGEVYIEHEGEPYVMIEPAGPGLLPPGEVGELTLAYLRSGKEFKIHPLHL